MAAGALPCEASALDQAGQPILQPGGNRRAQRACQGYRARESLKRAVPSSSIQPVAIPDIGAEDLRARRLREQAHESLKIRNVVWGMVAMREVTGPKEPILSDEWNHSGDRALVRVARYPALAPEVLTRLVLQRHGLPDRRLEARIHPLEPVADPT